jgi:hypothetical protein
MAEKKRTDFEIDRDRSEISILYTQEKKTHAQIAAILNTRRQREYEEAVTAASRDMESGRIPAIVPPYTLSRQQITEDIAQIRRRFVEITAYNLDELKGAQLAKIDALEAKAWDALEASGQPTVKTTNVIAGADKRGVPYYDKNGDLAPVLVKQTNQSTQNVPDPLWAKVILDCVKQRCELFGLEAPKKSELDLNVMPVTLYGAEADIENL